VTVVETVTGVTIVSEGDHVICHLVMTCVECGPSRQHYFQGTSVQSRRGQRCDAHLLGHFALVFKDSNLSLPFVDIDADVVIITLYRYRSCSSVSRFLRT